jgi:spermidine/putrescine transport system ATP-binding protein
VTVILSPAHVEDEVVEILGVKFPCVDVGFGKNKPVDVVIRPEDVELLEPGKGRISGEVTSLIFKGVHYEMEVLAGGYEWLVWSTKLYEVGKKVDIQIDPFNIQVMNKPVSEDEEAVAIDE